MILKSGKSFKYFLRFKLIIGLILIFNTYLITNIILKKPEKLSYDTDKTNYPRSSIIFEKSMDDNDKIIKKSYLEKIFVNKNKRKNTKFDEIIIDFPTINKPLNLINQSIVYNSQILQDFILLQLLNTNKLKDLIYNGFFIEAGAYDGQTMSNTLHFERFRNWTGLLIEPSKFNYDKLLKVNRKSYSINCCLTSLFESHESYLIEAGPFSVTENNRIQKTENNVVCHSLDKILKKVSKSLNKKIEIRYLSLDLEGAEKSIIESFPWNYYDIKLISIEYNQNKNLYDWIIKYLNDFGFMETIKDDIYFQDVYLGKFTVFYY